MVVPCTALFTCSDIRSTSLISQPNPLSCACAESNPTRRFQPKAAVMLAASATAPAAGAVMYLVILDPIELILLPTSFILPCIWDILRSKSDKFAPIRTVNLSSICRPPFFTNKKARAYLPMRFIISSKSSCVVTFVSSTSSTSPGANPTKSLIDGTSLTCGMSVHKACSAFLTRSWYTFHSYASIAMLNSESVISQNSTGFIFSIAMVYFIKSFLSNCLTGYLCCRRPHLHHFLSSLIRMRRPLLLSLLYTFLLVSVRRDRTLPLPVYIIRFVFCRSAVLVAISRQHDAE